ncbi:adenylate/guanylate cyclase domain-containing protein [Candidatus Uabimicrobium sp. HlEnr_7]|uniref:adenylate/guanylate cyclase domain-containing protein n=1 Tax=Candidatus Uabimicrobium helgolandensis TaxID=3095367 RepID=UPI0035563B7F
MKRHLSLRNKIILTICVIITLIVVTANIFSLMNNNQYRYEALLTRAEMVAESQASAMASSIWEYDQDSAELSLKGLLKDPEFVTAVIFDDAGKLFAKIEKTSEDINSGVIVIEKDVYFQTTANTRRKIGQVRITMTTTKLQRQLRKQSIQGILEVFLLLLLVVPNLIYAIRKFTKPIEDMTRIMRMSAEGKRPPEINSKYLKREDEIGAIANSLKQDQQQRQDEMKLLKIATSISNELNLTKLLKQIITATTELLESERSSLFLYDEESDTLWSLIAEGVKDQVIRVKSNTGIVGETFTTKKSLIVQNTQNRNNFHKSVDKKTGFITKSILSTPMIDKKGNCIGVLQILNKRDGSFCERDLRRAVSLASQAAISIDNARLFEETLNLKNYQQAILESLSNGVMTFDQRESLTVANDAAMKILQLRNILEKKNGEIFVENNKWVADSIHEVLTNGSNDLAMDTELETSNGSVSVNLTTVPLEDIHNNRIGAVLAIEDITKEKRIRNTMSRYMSKTVLDRVLEDDPDILNGSQQVCSILFSDIRKFTTISETIGARNTVTLLNSYFEEMVSCIMDRGGILDKYIGDAIMASFGAPFTKPQDAQNAVLAAVEMMKKLVPFNKKQQELGAPTVDIGIGINTGDAIAGNIGSSKRVEYTVIGDTVNLASRLEGVTKFYGAPIVISEYTHKHLKDNLFIRPLDYIRVKGKNKPVLILEVMDHYCDSFEINQFIEFFIQGFDSYRERNFSACIEQFAKALEVKPGDITSKMLMERARYYVMEAPPENWDGVWVMKEK